MIRLTSYSVKDATKWLSDHGLGVSGTKKELNNRIRLYQRCPKLVEKLRKRNTYNKSFSCGLNVLDIPPLTAPWISDSKCWPMVSEEMFTTYCKQKREGNAGQQAKAIRMLESRKIVNIKTLPEDSNKLYVRALINPSFGSASRPAVLLFEESIPMKGYCECAVGSSGICCHILALLLFLKHYQQTGEVLLELTCTQQLQKWHRRCKKGSIPMLPLAQIKGKAAKVRKAKTGGVKIVAADPHHTNSKRNVNMQIEATKKRIAATGLPVMDHFYSVLSKSSIGRKSGFGGHICHIYSKQVSTIHDYAHHTSYVAAPTPAHPTASTHSHLMTRKIILQDELPLHLPRGSSTEKNCQEMEADITSPALIELDLQSKEAPQSFGSNYINCEQRTEIWDVMRKKRVTGSRLPSLLGFYGNQKLLDCLNVVKGVGTEKDLSGIINIQRGIIYEDEAVQYFEKLSGSTTKKVGFFIHPKQLNFGASPDAVCASGLLLEVKTRAVGSEGPLKSLDKFPNYFVQCQLQMACTNAQGCILLSYHPETKTGHFFLVKYNPYLTNIIMEVVEAMVEGTMLKEWTHLEPKRLKKVGEQLLHKQINFENLKTFRAYIKSVCSNMPRIKFCEKIDFKLD